MNKKFSTLLVSTLLACGTAFTAQAADYNAKNVKAGVNTFLQVGGSKYLGLKDGKLTIVDNAVKGIAELQECIWTIEKVEFPSASGNPSYGYKFLHNQSGQYLSIKLQSNTGKIGDTEKKKENLEIESGNTVWAWDAADGLYAVANDSTYTVAGTTLYASNAIKTGTGEAITYKAIAETDFIPLDAANFNVLTKGTLYFNGTDVAGGQKNVLTDNKWTAVDAKIGTDAGTGTGFVSTGATDVLYFYNQATVAGYNNEWKEDKAKKNYLVVDNGYYDSPTNTLFTLAADTLSFEPINAAAYKEDYTGVKPEDLTDAKKAYLDAMKALDATSTGAKIDARTAKTGKHHPFAGAFTATYNYYTDVITLTSLYQPVMITVQQTLGTIITNTTTTFTSEDIFALAVQAQTFITNAGGTYNGKTFADGKTVDFQKANAAIAELTGDDNKAKKAVADAFMAAIAGMKISVTGDLTIDKYKAAAFVDGVNPLKSAADKRDVVVRKLATVQVLTIHADGIKPAAPANLDPMIQPYKSKPAAGGDAVIAEGIYYIKNLNTVEDGKANPNYGMFYDASPVNGTDFVKEAQAFNPYAQFVVTPAPAAAKGNYQFTCLADADSQGAGVVMKAGENYVINGDTIALVAAGKLADVDKYLGSAHFTAAELKNSTFTIASASAVLKGETFTMLEDSTITLSADKVAFKLIAGSEVKDQGYDKKLAYVPYAIMTEDSLAIAKVDGKYVFTTQKVGKKVAGVEPVNFRLLATGSESTYVLYDVTKDDEAKVGINVQDKTVIVVAEEALNDLFTVTAVEAPASYKTTGETAKIQIANSNLAINNDNQAVSVREGDLRAAYVADDFVFTLDTAKYEGAETYTYFITKEVADKKLIMWEATDSANVENAVPYHAGLDTRVLFRTLNKIDNDTVYVANLSDVAKEDTVKTSTSYQFSFAQKSDDAADGYIMQSGDKYVAVANGVVVVTGNKEDAAVVAIETVEGPTANEAVAAAEVSVVGANGAIIVKGAAGKVVTVANILGQTIANQVAVSDNVTIAAPAGVAIVTVDGEATKVVVK